MGRNRFLIRTCVLYSCCLMQIVDITSTVHKNTQQSFRLCKIKSKNFTLCPTYFLKRVMKTYANLVTQFCLFTVEQTFLHSLKTLHSFSRLVNLQVGYLLLSKFVVDVIPPFEDLSIWFWPTFLPHVELTTVQWKSRKNVPNKIWKWIVSNLIKRWRRFKKESN